MELDDQISSKAVVNYEGPATIPSYIELDKDTDLNHPPSNWLRDNLIGKFPYRNARKTEPFDYSSLLMAGRYPEMIGEVDVVAGANMIKKLLKMPFSDSSLSMSVHRVGKTLLLNKLDIPALLQSPYYSNNNNLAWLKDLYCEARGIPLSSEFHPKKRNKEQSQLQLILSKFMYHSIEGGGTLGNNPTEKSENDSPKSIQEKAVRNDVIENEPTKCESVYVEPTNNYAAGKLPDKHSIIHKDPASYDALEKLHNNSKPSTSYDVMKHVIPSDINADWSKTAYVANNDWSVSEVCGSTPDYATKNQDTPVVVPSILRKSDFVAHIDSSERVVRKNNLVAPIDSSERVTLRKNDITPSDSSERFDKGMKSDAVFLRDVLWTFEDITMLVGSDLPIFGGGKYPAVSLRLSDSSKPINILTGIDYWLDNLMCNVPELIMCFHLKGIVQKYEKIKTSDLPDIDGSSFSPKVIKDIAQNILSFLKANCTKEGHTYWLFKSTKDDVIKLYDLTSICAEKTYGKQQDPFSVSVAVLLYNIARNMYTSGEINSRNICKIRSLLKNCISLLESKDRPDISLLANCLLIELYSDQDEESDGEYNSFEDDSEEIYSTDDDLGENEKIGEPITTVSVKTLGIPSKIAKVTKENKLDKSVMVAVNDESRCKSTILLISSSLKSINILLYMYKVTDISEGRPVKGKENINTQIKSLQHKQSNQTMLAFIQNDLKCFYRHKKKNVSMQTLSLVDNMQELSLGDVRILLLEKAVEVHLTLININISKEKFGRALRFIQTCCYCLDNAKQTSNSSTHNKYLSVEILKLHGDVLTIMANKNNKQGSEVEDFYALNEADQNLYQLLEYDDTSQFFNINIKHIADSFVLGREELLNTASGIYEEAISIIGDDNGQCNPSYQMVELSRRLGNIRNELGVLYMNKAASISKQCNFPSDEEMALWKRSYALYEGAIMSFKTVNDRPNMALLYLNCAKLMHLCAQVFGNSSRTNISETRGPFTQEEKMYFNKSFEYYQKALSVLHSKEDFPNIWTNVSLELSGAYFTMAITMQENDANEVVAEEKVIKEISSAFMKALHYSESVVKDCDRKQEAMVKHRMGSIHHRLATLYYHLLKNQTSDNGKKNYRSLSELHYKKIYVLVQPNLFPIDVLRVILEHMNFYEYVLKQASSWKYLKLKFEMFLPGKPPGGENSTLLLMALQELLKRLNERNENVTETEKLSGMKEIDIAEVKVILSSLDVYINATLKEIIKFLSHKKNKKGDFIDVKVVKKVYEIVLRGLTVKDNDVVRNLNAFVRVISSIRDVHTL